MNVVEVLTFLDDEPVVVIAASAIIVVLLFTFSGVSAIIGPTVLILVAETTNMCVSGTMVFETGIFRGAYLSPPTPAGEGWILCVVTASPGSSFWHSFPHSMYSCAAFLLG